MRCILTTIIFLILSQHAVGQKYVFSPTGMMEPSHLYVDTLISTNLRSTGKTFVGYLHDSNADVSNFSRFFATKFAQLLLDSFEFFMVVNLTSRSISFKRNDNRLVAEELGRFENFGLKPISFFIHSSCGSGINHDLILKPSQILIVKSLTRRRHSDQLEKPNCILKLLTSTNGILVSVPYAKAISNSQFYIQSEFEKYFRLIWSRVAF